MARIETKQPGQAVADFSVNGHLITVSGVQVDCRAMQQDSERIVEVRQSGGSAHIGGDGAYLAHITIPAKVYIEVPSEEGEEGEEGEGGGVERVAQELDPNAVAITLWSLAN